MDDSYIKNGEHMKICISIVTYKNTEDLNNNLESLLSSKVFNEVEVVVEVINNHSEFFIRPEFESRVEVIHNKLRPDWSTGHLSRDYNSALIRRFRNLNTPDCDWVLTGQDDVIWKPDWFSAFKEVANKGFTFITSGNGCTFVASKAEAIKKIGIWDERFCANGYQEADFFLRAIIWNGPNSSINDPEHARIYNPTDNGVMYPHTPFDFKGIRFESDFIQVPNWNVLRLNEADRSRPAGAPLYNYDVVNTLFTRKWPSVNNNTWSNYESFPREPSIDTYMYYPYFEKDIENRQQKRYLV